MGNIILNPSVEAARAGLGVEVGQVEIMTTDEFKEAEEEVIPVEDRASQLPVPTGYKLLIALPAPDEKTEGGILKAADTLQVEETGSIVGFVLAVGPDAYQDKKRFPNGPYCKEGDLIMMRAYSGTRFAIHSKEFRLINDDSVEALIDDPRGIRKL